MVESPLATNARASSEISAHTCGEWIHDSLEALFEASRDATVITNSSGTIVLVNAQTEMFFGYTRQQMIGQSIELLLPNSLRAANDPRTMTRPGPRPQGTEISSLARRHDGLAMPTFISRSHLNTRGGLMVATVIRDSTERRRKADRFGLFLESAPDAIIVVDTSGTIVFVNAQTERLFGHAKASLIGESVEMLMPSRFRHAHVGHRAGYIDTGRTGAMGAGLELFGQMADGYEFPIDVSLAPVETDEGKLICATIRDISERKQLESARDVFIHHAAHELRTPLATLAALGEALAMRMSEMSEENVAAALGALKRQGERARTLVANLLDLSLLERRDSNVRLTPVDLGLSIARAIEGAPAPGGKSVTTDLETANWMVLADPVQLDRVFTNLITNAYRYGGSQIRIAAQRDGGSIIVDVSDNGEGVPADIADKIFLPFVRGKLAGEVGGSGVGLTLCRRIVEALGGVIWYDSTTPGSHFKFRLREYK